MRVALVLWLVFAARSSLSAPVLTGTPTAIDWGAGINPSGQSVNVPADATQAIGFWAYYSGSGCGTPHGLASITLGGFGPDQTVEFPLAGAPCTAVGAVIWHDPPTGSQTLDPAWDVAPDEGPSFIIAWVKDGDTSAWRDADAISADGGDAASVTLTTVSGDLVLKFQKDDGDPVGLTSGWTSAQTQSAVTVGGDTARLSYISASGTSQVCAAESPNYAGIACAVIAPGGGGGSAVINPITGRLGQIVN